MLKAFVIAMQLLTRIPLPLGNDKQLDEKAFGLSVLFYPVVGLVIGGILVLVQYLFTFMALPSQGMIEAAVILILWVFITGALHLDGLADSADAWLGGYGDKARTLEIMKDPYCGPAGVVILVLVLLVKFSTLVISDWKVLLLAPVLGRTAVMLLLASTAYVRKGGIGESAANQLSKPAVWSLALLVTVLSVLLLKDKLFVALSGMAVIFLTGYLLRILMLKRIGGTTGDTAGALVEITEATVLLVFVLLAGVQ